MLSVAAVLTLLAGSALAADRCGNRPSMEEVARAEHAFVHDAERAPEPKASPQINVVFHVIRANKTLEGGDVPKKQLEDQITVLNNDYAGSPKGADTGISFVLQNITRTTNKDWFDNAYDGQPQQDAMKKALRVGDVTTLNLYSVGFTNSGGLLGYATFPWWYAGNPSDDGVVYQFQTVPGGTLAPYNEGRTLTHEIGHWTGLYHTFQGGCKGKGDQVADTPAEAGPVFGCPSPAPDSCPGKAGKDPIQNYMDYTDDGCMTNFSAGQVKRQHKQLKTYRGISF